MWNLVTEIETSTRINHHGLALEFARMRNEYEQTTILDRDTLSKIATAINARYVFQPRLVAFSQTMTDRWTVPAFNMRVFQTRSSLMRVTLQLWDTETGTLLWASIAEATMENEAVSQGPVYMEDIMLAKLGSMVVDLVNGRSTSNYTRLNKFIGGLLREAKPEERDTTAESAEEMRKYR